MCTIYVCGMRGEAPATLTLTVAAPAKSRRAGANAWSSLQQIVVRCDSLTIPLPTHKRTDSEESVRVVKSARARAFEAFESNVKALRNAMRNNDHKTLMEEFDTLTKAMAKSQKVFADNGGIPRFLVRILCDLEDHVRECLADKAAFKKLKPAQGRALNRMKLSLKKHNATYAGIMEEYRKNPVISESEKEDSSSSSSSSSGSDDDSDSDSSSSGSSAAEKKPKAKAAKSDSDSVSCKILECVVLAGNGDAGPAKLARCRCETRGPSSERSLSLLPLLAWGEHRSQ